MLDTFFYAGLPYIAVFVLVFGSIYRFRNNQFSYSALSSQFLESKKIRWGSPAWHAGILILLVGHVLALGFPSLWQLLVSNWIMLMIVEAIGIMAAALAIVGLSILIYRRVTSARMQSISSLMDFTIVFLLLFQVVIGLGVALSYRWGAAWAPGALGGYIWSLLKFQPDVTFVQGMPGLIQVHIVTAWIILLLVPFSRLVHVFSVPFSYLWRPPQRVIWANPRRFEQQPELLVAAENRRDFLRASVGLGAGGVLLSMGVAEKTVRYFSGPTMDTEEEADLLEKRVERLEMTTEQRQLELERLEKPHIHVASINQLNSSTGKYFIDYQMRPALAFLGEDGLPLLISAKCTHLGCTVGNQLDDQGRILCPCHVSYFDIETGQPNTGAPAKAPLPHIGWVAMDKKGNVLASQAPDGKVEGAADPEALKEADVYIARKFNKETA